MMPRKELTLILGSEEGRKMIEQMTIKCPLRACGEDHPVKVSKTGTVPFVNCPEFRNTIFLRGKLAEPLEPVLARLKESSPSGSEAASTRPSSLPNPFANQNRERTQ